MVSGHQAEPASKGRNAMRTISTFLVVVSLVIVSFFAGLASQEKPVHAGGERACPPGAINENVNGDNSTDLGDAIFLLNYLFTGGPAPCDNRRDLEFVLGRIGYVFAFPQTPLRLARGFTTDAQRPSSSLEPRGGPPRRECHLDVG